MENTREGDRGRTQGKETGEGDRVRRQRRRHVKGPDHQLYM